MTYRQAVADFERIYIHLYINRVDYWTADLAWADYTDSLCKGGEITQKQWETWSRPFPYAKPLKPSYRQLCIANDVVGLS